MIGDITRYAHIFKDRYDAMEFVSKIDGFVKKQDNCWIVNQYNIIHFVYFKQNNLQNKLRGFLFDDILIYDIELKTKFEGFVSFTKRYTKACKEECLKKRLK